MRCPNRLTLGRSAAILACALGLATATAAADTLPPPQTCRVVRPSAGAGAFRIWAQFTLNPDGRVSVKTWSLFANGYPWPHEMPATPPASSFSAPVNTADTPNARTGDGNTLTVAYMAERGARVMNVRLRPNARPQVFASNGAQIRAICQ